MFKQDKDILSFDGTDYAFLSNFYEAPIIYEDKRYPTSEHLFQARKATNNKDHYFVRTAPTPAIAKRRGRQIQCRKDWDAIRVQVMREVLELKFSQHPELKEKLLATGHFRLVEGNWWKDRFWGVYNGKGQNWLGKLLMELRDKYRK